MRWRGGRRGGIQDHRGVGPVTGGGIGVAVIALLGYFVLGIDPQLTTQVLNQFGAGGEAGPTELTNPEDEAADFANVILTSTTDVWTELRPGYQPPVLRLYEQGTSTGCGFGQAAMGPFYCPADRQVYIDLGFWRVMEQQLGAGGDFAQAYVIAHEVGHHVQTVDGTSARVETARRSAGSEAEANRWSVALELQADCYAGVWAHHVARVSGGEVALEAGDLEEGLRAASAIGDDTLQRRQGGQVVPDSFTHGSSEQRVAWLREGYQTGDPAACDTFR